MKISPSKIQVSVSCKKCNIVFTKRKDTLSSWQGNCRSCAQKIAKSDNDLKKKMSVMSRKQLLRQGGIPNARKFTTENSSGSKSYSWKGGITPLNMKIRTSLKMIKWRKAVFERDNYTCVMCNKRGGYKEADHIKPFAVYKELRFDINNGRTLCKPCHIVYGAKVSHGKVIKEATLVLTGK